MPRRSLEGNWSLSAFTYTKYGIEKSSAASSVNAGNCVPNDFLSFLGTAQSLNIDFLPLTWQPTLDALDEGNTAEIRQALVNIQASFAFKVPKVRGTADDDLYNTLIAEVSILGSPPI